MLTVLPFLLEIVDTGQKLMSSDRHFKWKECEYPSNIMHSSSPVTVQLGKSHLFFSFGGLELNWPSGSILVFIFFPSNNLGSCTLVFFPLPLTTAFPGCSAIFAHVSANILAHLAFNPARLFSETSKCLVGVKCSLKLVWACLAWKEALAFFITVFTRV